jgi:hypothetical protein
MAENYEGGIRNDEVAEIGMTDDEKGAGLSAKRLGLAPDVFILHS